MKDNGKMIKSMEREFIKEEMDKFTKVILKMVKEMVTENATLQMGRTMTDNGETINPMDSVN